MAQTWHDLLFAHWPVPISTMRKLVPAQLELDTWDGSSWVGVVPFWMSGVRGRGLPALPGASQFPELNVRTYVTYSGKPGVYFFSLDAASRFAVTAARTLYHLPYFYAKMHAERHGDETLYSSVREKGEAKFCGRYKPIAAVQLRRPGTIEYWLSERYCLYTVHKEVVYRGDVHHERWPLQDAQAEIELNSIATAAGLDLPGSDPLLHFARHLEVAIWPLRRAGK